MPEIRGSVVVIAGASSGIGRAAAQCFARDGAKLVLAGRRWDTLDEVVQECTRLGAQAIAVPTDVGDAAAVKALADKGLERFGRVDAWISNAGVGAVGDFDDVPMDAHERVVRTNLLGEMHGAHAILPVFKRQGAGVLIHMISIGGWVPTPYAASYAATKFGLRGFSEALRGELSGWPRIHVCDVVPTLVDTPGLAHGGNYVGKSLRATGPMLSPSRSRRPWSPVRRPRREVLLGPGALAGRVAQALAPGLVRGVVARGMRAALRRARPVATSPGNLFQPPADHAVTGGLRTGPSLPRLPKPAMYAVGGILGLWLARRL
ncbi:SDR family oxidoreductase [Roseomonas sp. CCTCC AB2023176]|uniref:SDR family oxidoreductase n=1 Tax=Roseomonas sp. CCTCC AB2023176 TaxID=3342640 RepID=UPI0035E0A413